MSHRLFLRLLGLITPSVLVVAMALLLMQLPKNTHVQLELTVDRFNLRPGGRIPITLIQSGRFQSASFNRFEQLRFWPSRLEIADEALFDHELLRFPTNAWRALPHQREVIIAAFDTQLLSAVTLTPDDSNGNGLVQSIIVEPGVDVIVEAGGSSEKHWLNVHIESRPRPVHLTPLGDFLISADYVLLQGTQLTEELRDSLTLRTASKEGEPLIEITGTERGLILELESATPIHEQEIDQLLTVRQIPISEIDFTRQDETGRHQSTIVGDSVLRYPELSAKAEHQLIAGDFVTLEGLKRSRIESIHLTEVGNQAALQLRLDTFASIVRIGTPERSLDARLTWFDWLWHNPTLRWLFTAVVWIVPTSLAGFKLWRELTNKG